MPGKIILHQLIGNESQALLFSAELKGEREKREGGSTTEGTTTEATLPEPVAAVGVIHLAG